MAQPRALPLLLLERVLCAHAEAIAGARMRRGLPVAPRAVAEEVLSLHSTSGSRAAMLRRQIERVIAALIAARAASN